MSAQVQKWLDHIRTLAVDIGPRGPTTEGERLGAQYCATVLRQLGLAPQVEGFTSARSIFQPHLLTAAALLLAFVLYPLAGRAGAALAALISLVALVSDLLELSFSDNPLRRIVRDPTTANQPASRRTRPRRAARPTPLPWSKILSFLLSRRHPTPRGSSSIRPTRLCPTMTI